MRRLMDLRLAQENGENHHECHTDEP
jgi:hypothetical protein